MYIQWYCSKRKWKLTYQKQCQDKYALNLPVEHLKNFPCVVSCRFWLACDVLVGSLTLTGFALVKQFSALREGCAEDEALLWCIALLWIDDRGLDKVVEGLNVLQGPGCPDGWIVLSVFFTRDFSVPLVETVVLLTKAKCLEGFAFILWVFRLALHTIFSGRTAWVPVRDCDTFKGGWFSLAVLELLGWDRLKGTGLVQGFFFLAFPCSKINCLFRT